MATGCGFGYAPIFPGTFGALWGLPLSWAVVQIQIASLGPRGSLLIQLAVIAALCAVGIPICTLAARRLGGDKDPSAIVWDEIASMPITFLFVPWDAYQGWALAGVIVLGFLLHRICDISKPPPCRQVERFPAGLGIMADDWFAAAYACLLLHGCLWAASFFSG
ncbi:MAG: phosphatidylglycerophosphatase A [Planctomycetales bacterium]|nr:phosphatidylglycerophosphatase A [Planctomycetales bacterium]NIP04874.1 phosphatidylglycerophosphatase A [Planctomycetales bacterium]